MTSHVILSSLQPRRFSCRRLRTEPLDLAAKSIRKESETYNILTMAPTLSDVKPKPGDLIEIFRGSYQHWAVYIGDGYVVHLTSEVASAGSGSSGSVFSEGAVVKRERLWDVVGTDEWKINNILDETHHPRAAHAVVQEARSLVGKVMPYFLLTSNCEHFATELRYGKAHSRQVRDVAIAAGATTALVFALTWAIFGGTTQRRTSSD